MHTEFVLVDGRWRKQGWLEAFRLRLTGWLPSEHVAAGVEKGTLKWSSDDLTAKVELSDIGADLTDAHPASNSEENIQMIANVLLTLGFECSWMEPSDPKAASFIDKKLKFDAAYRDEIYSALQSPHCKR